MAKQRYVIKLCLKLLMNRSKNQHICISIMCKILLSNIWKLVEDNGKKYLIDKNDPNSSFCKNFLLRK